MEITRQIEWDAAHRVMMHESKCATLHGHRYRALITVTIDKLDDLGRVVDFGVIKERVGGWVDNTWDHTTLINHYDHDLRDFCDAQAAKGNRKPYIIAGEPTAENIAAELLTVSARLLSGTGVTIVRVEVFETPNCSATAYEPSDAAKPRFTHPG